MQTYHVRFIIIANGVQLVDVVFLVDANVAESEVLGALAIGK